MSSREYIPYDDRHEKHLTVSYEPMDVGLPGGHHAGHLTQWTAAE